MDNRGSQSDEKRLPPSDVLRQKLVQIDETLAGPAPAADNEEWTVIENGQPYVDVIIGTSEHAKIPGMVEKIDRISSQSKHLGPSEVVRRLAMGDDGVQANRVR